RKGRRATPQRGVRLIAGGVTTGRRGYAPSPLRPGGVREKTWERRRSASGMAGTPLGCRGEKSEGCVLRLRGSHPRLMSTAPSGQWHEREGGRDCVCVFRDGARKWRHVVDAQDSR